MKSKFATLILVAIFLTACGGGGGGGGGSNPPTVSSSSAATAAPIANAGADVTVKEGETVNLDAGVKVVNQLSFTSNTTIGTFELTGSSTNASDIVKLQWTQLEGTPRTGFSFSGSPSENFSFTAPDTGTADSIQIVYELTLTNAAGQAAKDTVAITVNRVNEMPVANAGIDQSAESETAISLSATGSSDPDGTIKSFAWVQTAGGVVALTDANKGTATFTAPSVIEATTYEFELTVTDNNDATAKDKVVVTITPKDAPRLTIYFPTPVGVYKENTISAFGSAEAINANLSKVEVSVGGDFAEASLADGKWRLNDIVVPETDTFELTVKATDSLGKVSLKKSRLKKSGAQGTGKTWTRVYTLGVDNETNKVFAFSKTGTLVSGVRVHAVDLNTGNRADELSNFSVASQGVNSTAVAGARYNPATKTIYASISPSAGENQIIGINVTSGQRTIISDSTHGSGPSFSNPVGITFNSQGQLFVADNGGKIIRVETATGDRTEIANTSTLLYSVNFAVDAVLDPSLPNSLFVLPKLTNSAVLKLLLDVNPVSSSLITNSATSAEGPAITSAENMEVDVALQKLFLVDGNKNAYEVNMTNGNRTVIPGVTINGMGYDYVRHLLYYNDNVKNAIWVMDPISKHKVMISGSVD